MKPRHPSRLLAGAALLSLVLSFLVPLPAWADDGAPPPDPTAPEAVPLESVPPTEVSPPEAEALPGEAEGTAELQAPAEAAPPPAEALPESPFEQMPEGTAIAVVGAEGELLPLVSEAAAEGIAAADPVWCPASLNAPTPDAGGCSPAEASMADLLTWLVGHEPATDGIIWIQGGVQSDSSPIVFDGGIVLTTMSQYKLTLRGGWDGTPGSKIIDPANPSVFAATLGIYDWRNDITLSDLVVDGTLGGIGSHAIDVRTEGSISLTGVDATDNQGAGAWLVNSGSPTRRGVTVKQGEFSGNSGDDGGLHIVSAGKITLTDVIASSNSGSGGAQLSTSLAGSGSVTLSGANVFEDNAYSGLLINSAGAISLGRLTASRNGQSGVSGDGAEIYNNSALSPMAVTLTGPAAFEGNFGMGLSLVSRGAITIGDVSARDNGSQGLGLLNSYDGTVAGVTLLGTNVITGNGDHGIRIDTRGPIKLNNVHADSNAGNGAYLTGTSAVSAQPVSITGTNTFKYNSGHGLYLLTNGAVTARNVSASGNTDSGVFLNNRDMGYASKVTFTGASAFNDNGSTGLDIYTWGSVTLANLTASRNGNPGVGWGVDVSNYHIPYTTPVTLTGVSVFDGNFSGGLRIQSSGAIVASNLSASRSISGPGAHLSNSNTESPQKVSLTGTSSFSGNADAGLLIYSLGTIGASNLTAAGNASDGAFLRNDYFGAVGGVTVSGANLFTDNAGNGLVLISYGAISAGSLTAAGNASDGVHLSNSGGTGAGVKLTGVNDLSGNGSGLTVYSRGPIALANVTAFGSTVGNGVTLVNTFGGPDVQPSVSLTGTNTFNDNQVSGLSINTYGAVALSSVTANRNGVVAGWGYGLMLDNYSGTQPKPVTLSGTFVFDGNDEEGLHVYSRGAIKAGKLTASNNGAYGAWLYTYDGITSQPVSLTGPGMFENNFNSGLSVTASGAIRAANLTAHGNALGVGFGFGVSLANDAPGSTGGITLTGTNVFTGNRGGVNATTTGAISVSNLTASGSTADYGADLRNGAGSPAAVTLSGTATFEDNWWSGLNVISTGPISLNVTRLRASGNGTSTAWGHGVSLTNSGAAAPQKVTVKGTSVFTGNLDYGLSVSATGPISASNLTASGSLSWGGVTLSTSGTGSAGSVTLSGTNTFQDNRRGGLSVNTLGPITVSNLTATGNGLSASNGYGASLSNNVALAPQAVKLTGVNTVSGNYWGLYVSATGPITVNSLTASGNTQSSGAVLDNTTPGSVGGVTLTGTNVFEDNFAVGLDIDSLGAITANNLRSSGNGLLGVWGYGVTLHNHTALTPQNVKLTGSSSFLGDQSGGLVVYSAGAVTASNLTAHGSITGNGVLIDNSAGTAGVTLTGVNLFGENASSGLSIGSSGALALTRIHADGNGGTGLLISSGASLTLTCGSFTNNGFHGLAATTTGMPALIGVVASGNGSSDLWWSGGPITGMIRTCPLY